jgi:DNA-binding XRE family transcriptional regulator
MFDRSQISQPVGRSGSFPTPKMILDWHIGDVIAKLRKSTTRLNQTALAEKVGVNKATIVRAENGDAKVSREIYWKIALALNTNLAALEGEAARLQASPSPPGRAAKRA